MVEPTRKTSSRSTPSKPRKKSSPAKNNLQKLCPIIGIGTSAGGLEALELFLANVPEKSGLAFVIVQHLGPNYKGIMAELLQRKTSMPVKQIEDRMLVEPEHVYVIPPNQDLSILHGVLRLLEPTGSRGLRLPIDFFLRSLAEDQQERSVGVILSGMGSDGSQGLLAIKEKGGGVFAQDPATAGFDGMPSSAIKTGFVDVVAPVEDLPECILTYLRHVPDQGVSAAEGPRMKDQSGLEKIILLLRSQTGHDFSLYKKNTLYRRIERRMGLHQLTRIQDYARFLRENPQETTLLFKELLIGVTRFFRDPEVWAQLKDEIIPQLLADRPEGGELRAWVPACSTGEEAYSLAMIFREALDNLNPAVPYALKIFATDLDKDAIDKARAATFPANILSDVSDERLRHFFVQDDLGYRVRQDIREMVVFAPQNVLMDPPFTKLDLLTCRNLLIYLEPELQKKLLTLFHYSLNPHGILLLGTAETIGQMGDFYLPLAGKNRLYQRQRTRQQFDLVGFPGVFNHSGTGGASFPALETAPATVPKLQVLTDALLLEAYTPAAVLTTREGNILYLSKKTGKYLEPAVGKANLNLFAMAREGLASLLYEAFHRALRENQKLMLENVRIDPNGSSLYADVSVHPLNEPGALHGMMLIVFSDRPNPPVTAREKCMGRSVDNSEAAALALELKQSRVELQTTREEMQSSQEELKSANEELQSTNEELQSTNEELTTSKEEMQSMNEELQTVNQELQAKVDELSLASDDMKNLLNSTEIATLFLDDQLNVRRFTPQMTRIFKLIVGDVGRPITDIVSDLNYPHLIESIREVLRTLIPQEKQIPTHDGRWFMVRVMPYRTQKNRIDGVVITFLNVTRVKNQEDYLTEALSALNCHFEKSEEQQDRAQILESAVQKAQAALLQLKKIQGERP